MKQIKIHNTNLREIVGEIANREELKNVVFDNEQIGFSVHGLDLEMEVLKTALDMKKIEYEVLI